MNKYFCVFPWIHFHAWANGMVMPCCMAYQTEGDKIISYGNLNDNKIEDIWNNDAYKKLRKNMLEGKPSEICHTCYKQESLGFHSFRQQNNKIFLDNDLKKKIVDYTKKDGTYEELDILYWDIRFNNICNFKCRMCSPHFSTKWYEDAEIFDWNNPHTFKSINNLEKWLNEHLDNLKRLKVVYFAGGEPLVQDEHYIFLNFLIKNNITDVDIYYQSNGSIIKHKKRNINDYWKHFKKVVFSISLDGFGQMGEYIRYGMKTNNVDKNLNIIHDLGYEVTVSTVSQLYNVYFLTEFWDELVNKPWCNPDKIYLQTLIRPEYLKACHLPDDLKEVAINKIYNYKNYTQYKEIFDPIINSIQQPRSEEVFKQFIEYTKTLDKRRNENILNWFSELERYF